MSRSWSVRALMAAVALPAVVLAGFRTHISLGALLLGMLGPAWVRTATWIDQRRGDGAGGPPGAGAIAGRFAGESLLAGLVVIAATVPAWFLFTTSMSLGPFRSHDNPWNNRDRLAQTVLGAVVATWPLVRLMLWVITARGAKRSSGSAPRRPRVADPTSVLAFLALALLAFRWELFAGVLILSVPIIAWAAQTPRPTIPNQQATPDAAPREGAASGG